MTTCENRDCIFWIEENRCWLGEPGRDETGKCTDRVELEDEYKALLEARKKRGAKEKGR